MKQILMRRDVSGYDLASFFVDVLIGDCGGAGGGVRSVVAGAMSVVFQSSFLHNTLEDKTASYRPQGFFCLLKRTLCIFSISNGQSRGF